MGSALLGGAVVVAGLTLGGCAKESTEPLVQESETAAQAPAPAVEVAPPPGATQSVALAELAGPGGASGVVRFMADAAEPGAVHVVAHVEGVAAGKHGFHLHAEGQCVPPDFKTAGDHFNPTGAPHGDPAAPPPATHHAGDFGNIEVLAGGSGDLDVTTRMLSMGDGGANDVIGKAVILHAGTDDFGQPTGNAGARIACGVVQQPQEEAVTGGTEAAANENES